MHWDFDTPTRITIFVDAKPSILVKTITRRFFPAHCNYAQTLVFRSLMQMGFIIFTTNRVAQLFSIVCKALHEVCTYNIIFTVSSNFVLSSKPFSIFED